MQHKTDASYRGFPRELLETLVCQKDGGKLALTENSAEYIRDGVLSCVVCAKEYVIQNGILDMLPEKHVLGDVLLSEIAARDNEAEKYDRRLSSRYYSEVISTMRALGDCAQKNIVEYGCGTGRLTKEVAPNAKNILAVDFSLESLKTLRRSLTNTASVGLVLADSIRFTTQHNVFDKALAAQFFEHIPTKEERHLFLRNVADALKKSGDFTSTVYHHDLRRRIKKLPQEGMHKSGIYHYYYTTKGMQKLLNRYFDVRILKTIDIMLPLEAKLHLPKKVQGWISRVVEHIPYVRLFGHLILFKGSPKK